jgi:RNA polymerase sigma factor (sigma-70 family)
LLLPPEKVQFLRDLITTDVLSLDAPRDDGTDTTLIDLVADRSQQPDTAFEEREIYALLQKALEQLPPKERKVLMLRFGMDSGSTMTLEQVGRIFNVTRERIRQIQEKALKRLRRVLRNMNLSESALTGEAPTEEDEEEVVSEPG